MSIAFFDLDRTLISKNSGTLWVRSEFRLGFITVRETLTAMTWLARYRLGVAEMESALEKAIASLTDVPVAEIEARTDAFYHREVADLYRPGGREAVAMHRERGDRLVLLTSSSPYLSRHVQAELDLDDFICTRFEVINGVHTGKPERPMAFGPGKVTLARAMADREGVDLADCHFYSDSMSDLPMLEAVGHPVVVHPDHKLNRLAKRRGWLVQDWGAA